MVGVASIIDMLKEDKIRIRQVCHVQQRPAGANARKSDWITINKNARGGEELN